MNWPITASKYVLHRESTVVGPESDKKRCGGDPALENLLKCTHDAPFLVVAGSRGQGVRACGGFFKLRIGFIEFWV